jgi:ERAP1-like C-terminal domain
MSIWVGFYFVRQKYFIGLLEPIYNGLGFPSKKDDDMLTIYKRVNVLTAACHLGYKHCVENSNRLFYMWMHDVSPDTNNPYVMTHLSYIYID